MKSLARTVWRNPTGRLGLVLIVAIVLFSVAGSWLIPYGPNRLDIARRFQGPSSLHWMGTDQLGRDLAARLAAGGVVALEVALSTIAAALLLGVAAGIAAGFAPSVLERAILVLFDIVSAFPTLILALAIVALLGPGLDKVIVIVAATLVPHFGRVARAQTLTLRNSPFLDAERVLGASSARIVLVHVVPNILGPLLVLASMDVPVVITLEAGFSFLGIGIPPPGASWGTLLYDGYTNLGQSTVMVLFPALLLSAATLGFTLFGEALRDAIDPRLQSAS